MSPDCLKCLESIKLHLPEELKRDLQDLVMQDERSVLSAHVYGAKDRMLRSRAADQAR